MAHIEQMEVSANECAAPEGPCIERIDVGGRDLVFTKGVESPLSTVPYHSEGPLTRWVLAELQGQTVRKVIVHEFDSQDDSFLDYCKPHAHAHAECCILFSHGGGRLDVHFEIEGHARLVSAPATVLIPANATHSMNYRSGQGVMIVIHLNEAGHAG